MEQQLFIKSLVKMVPKWIQNSSFEKKEIQQVLKEKIQQLVKNMLKIY